MKKALLVSLALLTLASLSSNARADAAYYDHIYATPIVRVTWTAQSYDYYTFETTDLQHLTGCSPSICPADTFMVVSSPDGNEYYNDDYAGTRRSQLTIFGPPGTYTVTVFASGPGNGGYTDVRVRDGWLLNVSLANNRRFGGRILQPSFLPFDTYRIQTAHNVDGAVTTQLIVYDSNWQQKDIGLANDGIGLATEVITDFSYYAGDRVVVGTTNASGIGSTAVFFDTCTSSPDQEPWGCGAVDDPDHDSLSNDLEALLGTDPDDLDSDNDGLYDYYEVVGRRIDLGQFGFEEEEFRMLGADPLRRDLFVEVDKRSSAAAAEEIFAVEMQHVFDDIPSLPLDPAGTTHIAIHADIGSPCAPTNATVCGDWGGHSSIDAPNNDPKYYRSRAYVMQNSSMQRVRWGTFHYMLRWDTCVGGMAEYRSWTGHECENLGRSAAHELGHNLGLCHWGGGQYDQSALNLKMNYPSVMNYAYEYDIQGPGFSSGSLEIIDHTSLDEESWSPGINVSKPVDRYDFETCPAPLDCPGAATPANAIDWNRDGRWTPGGVRFDVTVPRQESAAVWPIRKGAGLMGLSVPSGGPGLAVHGSTLYAFAVFGSQLKWTKTSAIEGSWSSWQTLSLPWTPDSSGETAAVVYPFSGPTRIMIVHPEATTKALHYIEFRVTQETVASSGPIPGWPAGVQARQASVAAVSAGVNIGETVHVAFRETGTSNRVWLARRDQNGWSSWAVQDLPSGEIDCTWGPGLAQGTANGTIYLACPDAAGDMFVYDRSKWSVSDPWNVAFDDFNAVPDIVDIEETPPRISLTTLPYLTASGQPFADGSEYLALFFPHALTNAQNEITERNWNRMYLGPLGPGISQFAPATVVRFTQASTAGAWHEHSVGAVRRGDHGAVAYTSNNSGNPSIPWHVPYGNGIPPTTDALHTDWDDGATIDINLCAVWCMVNGERCVDPLAPDQEAPMSPEYDVNNRCNDDAPTGSCNDSGGSGSECQGP